MNEDIKKILNGLSKKSSIYKMQINEGTSFNTDEYEANELLNYITNLQKENEELKALCDKYEEEHKNEFNCWKNERQQLRDYKQRNEKAVEYIKQHCDRPGKLLLPKIDFNYNDLLNVIQGGDEE